MVRRDYQGRFYGFRVNCENMPILPAWAVRQVWDDQRRIPYLMLWVSDRDGLVKEVVRVSRRSAPEWAPAQSDWIELKRTDGSDVRIYPAWQMLPRRGGRAAYF